MCNILIAKLKDRYTIFYIIWMEESFSHVWFNDDLIKYPQKLIIDTHTEVTIDYQFSLQVHIYELNDRCPNLSWLFCIWLYIMIFLNEIHRHETRKKSRFTCLCIFKTQCELVKMGRQHFEEEKSINNKSTISCNPDKY